jgi:hypothetical protein
VFQSVDVMTDAHIRQLRDRMPEHAALCDAALECNSQLARRQLAIIWERQADLDSAIEEYGF